MFALPTDGRAATLSSEDDMSAAKSGVSTLLPEIRSISVLIRPKAVFQPPLPPPGPELIMAIKHTHACNKRYYFCGPSSSTRFKASKQFFPSTHESRCSVYNNSNNNLPDKLSPFCPHLMWLFYPQEKLIIALMVLNLVIYEILALHGKVASDIILCQENKSSS